MRIVYAAENLVDAHLVKGALEAAGIPAHVAGEYLTGAMGELPALGLVSVMVAEHLLPAAREIAEACDAQLREARSLAGGDDELPGPATA
jgi:hypothetical protein